ncbi:MAG: T9SS type A sorting domain-containing protein [Bacteroidales bacterium]|nr:T9SS type A sorting domain-containing protein [Bacteroidales bacterium]
MNKLRLFKTMLVLATITAIQSINLYAQDDTLNTSFGLGADTYVSNDDKNGPDFNFGTMNYVILRTHPVRVRIGYLRFDISESPLFNSFEDAQIAMNVVHSSKMIADSLTFTVYGLTDQSLDRWGEDTIDYLTAPGIYDAEFAELNTYELDFDKVEELTTFAVIKDTTGWYYTKKSSAMDDFIKNDTNNLLTFIILKVDTTNDDEVRFSTKDDTSIVAPRLLAVSITNIDDKEGTPMAYNLSQNYPNPFKNVTTISYNLAQQAHVSLKVYNISGQLVTTLVDGIQREGSHTVNWNAKNSANTALPEGIYFAQIIAGSYTKTIRMNLMK